MTTLKITKIMFQNKTVIDYVNKESKAIVVLPMQKVLLSRLVGSRNRAWSGSRFRDIRVGCRWIRGSGKGRRNRKNTCWGKGESTGRNIGHPNRRTCRDEI